MEDESELEEEELKPPSSLNRKRSKEQFEHDVPYQELMMHTLARFLEMASKTRGTRPRNSTNRRVYDLRRYEGHMQKRRKLG